MRENVDIFKHNEKQAVRVDNDLYFRNTNRNDLLWRIGIPHRASQPVGAMPRDFDFSNGDSF